MKKILCILLIVLSIVSLSGCIGDDGNGWVPDPYWEWDLMADVWENITFSQDVIMCTNNGDVETMMDSIINIIDMIWVFQYQEGELVGWSNTLDPNYAELQYVMSNIPCYIYVNMNCTLTIDKC